MVLCNSKYLVCVIFRIFIIRKKCIFITNICSHFQLRLRNNDEPTKLINTNHTILYFNLYSLTTDISFKN